MSNENKDINSAASTALACPTERSLRVPCYCEENVWRLAYRKLHSVQNNAEDDDNSNTEKEYHVVFISNEEKCCPMFHQLAKEEDSVQPCLWDYHVILICTITDEEGEGERNKSTTIVLDMDSRAPYPCLLKEYLWLSFRKLEFIHEDYREKYAPKFRVVKATEYMAHFYSDRMHMYNTKTKTWHAKPPTYDCIMNGFQIQKRRLIKGRQQNNRLGSEGGTKSDGLIESGNGNSNGGGRFSNLDRYMDMTQKSKKKQHVDTSAVHVDDHNGNNKIGELINDKRLDSGTIECDVGREGNRQVYGHVFTLEEFEKEFCN